jgi:beta-phosphoglucomutase-like phosphatase (HAD superfamily)
MEAAEALVFDFNGTLSDDEPLLLAIYQELFARHGRPLSAAEYFGELAGNTEEVIIGTWLGVDGALLAVLVQERIATYVDRASSGSTVTRAVREAVRYAADRIPVAIVSGAFRAEIEPVVAAAGIADHVSVLVTADDVVDGKPHPEGYLRAVQSLAVDPARAVAFEDTEAGVASAKDAGLHCIAVRGTLPAERLGRADELVDRIDVALIERLIG